MKTDSDKLLEEIKESLKLHPFKRVKPFISREEVYKALNKELGYPEDNTSFNVKGKQMPPYVTPNGEIHHGMNILDFEEFVTFFKKKGEE